MSQDQTTRSICFVVQSHYDIDARVRRKVEALIATGYSVDVLCLRMPHRTSHYVLDGANVYTVSLGKQRGSLFRYVFEYVAFFLWVLVRTPLLMRRRRYAVIDVNTLPDFLVFAPVIARWMGAKIILDMHEITPEFYMSKYAIAERSWIVRLLKWQEKLSVDFADRVITVNEPIQDLLEERGLPRSKSVVVMNAVDEARYERWSEASAHAGASGEGKFVMIYHGTLTRIYGLDIAVEAFGMAHHDMPNAEFWILGQGPEADAIARQSEALGLSSKVRLLGHVPSAEIPGWLDQSTVGILPIRRDVFLDFAFPNKLPELIIAGKPVIISRLNAIRHYFSEEALAYFEPNDSADLAKQMVALYRSRERRESLVAAALTEYSPIRWDVMKRRYLTLIENVLTPERAQRSQAA